jgi:hypothetical protein
MIKKLPISLSLLIIICFNNITNAQLCSSLNGTTQTYESRCAATGSIKIHPSGGSGIYKYKAVGPISSNFTTSDSITGLPAGVYSVIINDITTNCEKTLNNVIITGNYQDARFDLSKVDVSCENGSNGSIQVINQQYGRGPFLYTIVAPSPMLVGTSNSTGYFGNLIYGDYGVRMTDSCGGVQTRRVYINNYTWNIDSYSFTKTSCTNASGFIKVIDSKGNVSTIGAGLPGFLYGIVRTAGDTIWSSNPNFTFNLLGYTNFQVIAKDLCGLIKTAATSVSFTPSVAAGVAISALTCNGFTASITNPVNIFNPNYCLYNSNNTLLFCNSTGLFPNLAYGSYCIKLTNGCADTVITRCFTQTPPPLSIADLVLQTNRTCSSFTASITAPVGLTNPSFCIYNSANVLMYCNATGVFPNLTYGSYCIKTLDGCRDTIITRCFTAIRPRPTVQAVVTNLYSTCSNFGILLTGDSLTTAQYCLYNGSGIQIVCNSTGIFDSLPYGSYCINVYDPCYDTTFIRCFTVTAPLVHNDIVLNYVKSCATFTLTASSAGLLNPNYCLYTSTNTLVACNTTGVFTNLAYGSYCLKSRNSCPDTTMTNCFTISQPVPTVSNSLVYSNYSCTGFTVSITGQTNLTSPNYCLYTNANVLISCNATGIFNLVNYGSYCIKIINTCYDTTISRCFTKTQPVFNLSVNSAKSCAYGFAYFNVTLTNGIFPVNVKIIRPNGNVLLNRNYNTGWVIIDSIPGTVSGQTYKVIATDACGKKDSVTLSATASYFNRTALAVSKCPSAGAVNGSGDIAVTASTNMGSVQVRITKRNGVTYSASLQPNTTSGNLYTFSDLTPAIYIIRYKENTCDIYLYDTVTVYSYTFPNLNKSSAYQCDVNGFSVGAVASGGVKPYTYEIIGSVPAAPSIISATQANPVFNINNGSNYSLIRLRAIDACGNGTLNDASIMPLANVYIHASLNCFAGPTTLTVDTIYNATYVWYKKTNYAATDSVQVGTGPSYYIPDLSPLDTGIYVCKILVNNGCIARLDYMHIDGDCTKILPTILKNFNGKLQTENILLDWTTTLEVNLKQFIIEKQVNNQFSIIGTVNSSGNSGTESSYSFSDIHTVAGSNIYRLKLIHQNGSSFYSPLLNIRNASGNGVAVYPNPVENLFNISFSDTKPKNINLKLQNNIGQVILIKSFTNVSGKIEFVRPASVPAGVYEIIIQDTKTFEKNMARILLK